MTLPLALLFIGLLLIALGLRSQEDGAGQVAAAGLLLFCVSLVLLTAPARAAEVPPAGSTGAEQFALVRVELLRQAAALIERQAYEIKLLRERLKIAERPKECI